MTVSRQENRVVVGILAIAFATLGVVPVPASADSCAPNSFDVDYAIEHADAVFAGKLVNLHPESVPSGYADSDAIFEVSKYWKGDVPKQASIRVQLYRGNSKTPSFVVGQEYVIYASKRNDMSLLYAYVGCRRQPLLSEASEDLAALGEGKIPSYTSIRDLTIDSMGEDVVQLQTILETKGFLVMPAGVAKGYFGPLTRAALAKYQASVGISPAVGFFGPITRNYISLHP